MTSIKKLLYGKETYKKYKLNINKNLVQSHNFISVKQFRVLNELIFYYHIILGAFLKGRHSTNLSF